MKFGLFSHVPWPEGVEPAQVYDQTMEQAQYGEALGFHSIWLAEHHFSRYGLGSSSLILMSHIAARTRTIRLGTAVLVPTLHNPLRLAEDTATLDVLSGGRLDVGYGRGAAGYEYNGYGLDREQSQARFREAITMVQGLWTTPAYTHAGEFFTVNHVNLTPPPVQKPHPPVYIAATRSPDTLAYVLATGHPLIVGVVLDTPDALDLCKRFVAMSQAAGSNVPMSAIPFFRYCYVAETEEQARKDTQAALNWNMDVNQWRRVFTRGSELNAGSLADFRAMRTELPPSYDYLYENRAFIGTPDQCAKKIQALRDQGIEYFGCNFCFGDIDHKKVLKSMELFSKEVMPRFL